MFRVWRRDDQAYVISDFADFEAGAWCSRFLYLHKISSPKHSPKHSPKLRLFYPVFTSTMVQSFPRSSLYLSVIFLERWPSSLWVKGPTLWTRWLLAVQPLRLIFLRSCRAPIQKPIPVATVRCRLKKRAPGQASAWGYRQIHFR